MAVECSPVARHQREVQHRTVVHLQLVVLHQAEVMVIEAEAEKMHFLLDSRIAALLSG